MGILAFLPWLRIGEPVSVGDATVEPYVRNKRPSGAAPEVQHKLDSIIEPYMVDSIRPVSDAAIMKFPGDDVLRDLVEQEIADAFLLAELLAICGLSLRKYFGTGLRYCNRDSFQLVIQRFVEDSAHVTVTTRRRDGVTTNTLPLRDFHVQKPDHVFSSGPVLIDTGLLDALMKARSLDLWDHCYESILCFNLANTDSRAITEEVEGVLTVSAFERLLDCSRGREDDVAQKFTLVLSPKKSICTSQCKRLSKPEVSGHFETSSPIRNAWIRDFFRMRGDLAHGRVSPRYPSVWSLREHLLLASLAFPLILKSRLAAERIYTLTYEDQTQIDFFERIVCEDTDLFVPDGDPWDSESFAWNRLEEQQINERLGEALRQRFENAAE